MERSDGARLGWAQPGLVGVEVIQIAPQMRILVAVEAVDGRKGIDSLAQLCQEELQEDPFSGCLFRSRRGRLIRILTMMAKGSASAEAALQGRLVWWPSGKKPARRLQRSQGPVTSTPARAACGPEGSPECSPGRPSQPPRGFLDLR